MEAQLTEGRPQMPRMRSTASAAGLAFPLSARNRQRRRWHGMVLCMHPTGNYRALMG